MSARSRGRRGFTITEILVVISVIIVLAGVLLAAMAAVRGTGKMTQSMNRMRQIGVWMRSYSVDNKDTVLPSQFDYSGNPYPGLVRTGTTLNMGSPSQGTWADILWSENPVVDLPEAAGIADYRNDSPDQGFYDVHAAWDDNPLRAAAANSVNAPNVVSPGSALPRPYGDGAQEAGSPGYFAANDFFNSRPDHPLNGPGDRHWWSNGQVLWPDRSTYLVDSYAGEVISDTPPPYHNMVEYVGPNPTLEVDFRYNGNCLMLFLDGHVAPTTPWQTLDELEGCIRVGVGIEKGRGLRVRQLHSRDRPNCL